MKDELFKGLEKSLLQAIEHAQGKRSLLTIVLPGPPRPLSATQVAAFRKRLNASQAVFAHYLNVSVQLVQAWEGDRRRPSGAALRLLELARRDPMLVFPTLMPPGKATKRTRAAEHRRRQTSR